MPATVAVRFARRLARAEETVRRLSESGQSILGAALGQALTTAERSALGLALYADALERAPLGADPEARPFDWETAWWAEALPPAPASVLIGGAGTGREVRALQAAGYEVHACDPVPAAAAALAVLLGPGRAACARHEDTSRWPGPARLDAVIFGWGSLTHVLDADDRRRILQAAAARTHGPILASVWIRDAFPVVPGRAVTFGHRLGRGVARARGLALAHLQASPDLEGFAPWCGFGHRFDLDELEALGRIIGRPTRFEPAPYPHVTWSAGPRTPPA